MQNLGFPVGSAGYMGKITRTNFKKINEWSVKLSLVEGNANSPPFPP